VGWPPTQNGDKKFLGDLYLISNCMSPAARGCWNAARVHDLVEGCYMETKFVLNF
jgi:hypothetical protein